jgi:hypothetical protein
VSVRPARKTVIADDVRTGGGEILRAGVHTLASARIAGESRLGE